MICLCFFFFKQKTAYEMRISDWSSDVCSSDLETACAQSRNGLPNDFCCPRNVAYFVEHRDVYIALDRITRRASDVIYSYYMILFKCSLFFRLTDALDQIGRASCRERLCQSV